jgi:hypothetical protein
MTRPFSRSIIFCSSAFYPLFSLGGPLRRGWLPEPAPLVQLHSTVKRKQLATSLLLCVALIAPAGSALADDRDRLTPGLYVAASVGCDGLGGGGTVDFDGKNFSPHYQACLTQPLSQNARYRQTCIEGQGPSYPTTAEIQNDPSKTTREVTIVVLSEKSFTMNGARYDYCGGR